MKMDKIYDREYHKKMMFYNLIYPKRVYFNQRFLHIKPSCLELRRVTQIPLCIVVQN